MPVGPATTMLKSFFRRLTARDIITRQHDEAMVLALEHEAAAEHHAALAQMYRERIERLRSEHMVGTQQSS